MNDKIIFRFKNIDNINGFGRKFLFAQVKTGRSKIAQSSLNVIWKWKAFYNFGLSFNFSLTGFISSVKCYMLMKFFRWESSTFLFTSIPYLQRVSDSRKLFMNKYSRRADEILAEGFYPPDSEYLWSSLVLYWQRNSSKLECHLLFNENCNIWAMSCFPARPTVTVTPLIMDTICL